MAIETVNIGSSPNDGTGDPLRTAFNKLNTNFLNITADGGDEITVTDPTTSTDGTLNDALANIYASGSTPDLQAVTDAGATTTNPIVVQDTAIFNTQIINGGFSIRCTDIATGKNFFDIGGIELSLNAYNGTDSFPVQQMLFDITGDLNQNFFLPNKPTGNYTLATTDDITGGGYTVVSSNQTAVNDTNYTVVANATFTDPTPTEGKGYVVYVRNGTATIGGTGYSVGSLVFRVYHSGSWSTREYKSNLTLDTTPTDGSTNGVESNGVFDALALKADKSTTRQIVRSKNNGTFGSHTGNTAETVLFTIPITGGEFEIGDWMDFMFQFERLVTGTNLSVRLRAGTNGNTSDPQIALLTMVSTTLDSAIKRERFEFNTGNILKGINSGYSSTQTDIANIPSARTSTSLNPANNWYLTVTASLGSGSDTILCTGYQIGKTKTF